MRIGFITPSISRCSGGIFEIQRRLALELQAYPEVDVSVYGLKDEWAHEDRHAWSPVSPQVFAHIGPSAFRYSPKLLDAVLSSNCDLLHLHVLWMATSLVTLRWSQRRRRPYVVTINGMLEPWALRNAAWKKGIARWLFEQSNLDNADCICVNSYSEFKSVRDFGLTNPVAIIPNGIDIVSDAQSFERSKWLKFVTGDCRKTLLFLSRLHPKKGLTNLLKAWGLNNEIRKAWKLVIAGWDESGHEVELKQLASRIGLAWSEDGASTTPVDVYFVGPQFGEDKTELFRVCDAFILPSFSEGFPMAVLEAWAFAKRSS